MKKITRRQFLTSAGATSAALLLSSLPHAAAADENCLRKVTPAATNSNDLSWDMAEEILTHISDPVFPAYTVNVLDYGAVPNDGKLDTAAIQRAIDETSAHGGGTVVIPSGVYDVGAITLKKWNWFGFFKLLNRTAPWQNFGFQCPELWKYFHYNTT